MAPARPDFLILGLAAAGFAIAAYLTGLKWMGGNAAFCLSGSGCDIVQGSRYGTLLGVPTALWGVLMYAAIGALAALGLTAPRWSWAFYLAAAGVGVSIYLTAVSVLVIHATCAYCLASGAIMVAILAGAAPPARASCRAAGSSPRSCPGPWPRRSWRRSAPPSSTRCRRAAAPASRARWRGTCARRAR